MRKTAAAFSALAVLALSLAFSAPGEVLPVPMIYQQQDNWCWAASCQMILQYYGRFVPQCAMANWCFGRSTCCGNVVWPNGTGSLCNQGNNMGATSGRDMDDVLAGWGPVYSVDVTRPLSWSEVQAAAAAGRPFAIGFSWLPLGSGGHAMVGKGYSGSYVYYNDPWPGNGPAYRLYSWMVSASDHVWDESLRLTTSPPCAAPLQPFAGDFSGSGKSDIAVFRNGLWSVRGVTRAYFGGAGDIPVPADFDGDGRSDLAVFRPATGLWSIRGQTRFYFGQAGDHPIPMHTHPGYTTAGIFRPATGLWSFRGGYRYYFGQPGDIPVMGPWKSRDGHWGEPVIGVFRPSTGLWSIRRLSRFYFGRFGDAPVPGVYTLSTSATQPWKAGLFRPATGLWALYGIGRYYFGSPGDIPVPADYTGLWGDKITVFRPSDGLWASRSGQRVYFGRSGDGPATR